MKEKGLRKQALRKELALFDERYELLGYDLSRQADPSVERLLEGFCYVTQQLERFIEASSPEVALHLLNILWPEVLSDIPALSVASMVPTHHPVRLPKQSVLTSIMEDQQYLRFSTMVDGVIAPLKIESASIEKGCIALNLMLQGSWDRAHLEKLLFYVDPQAEEACNVFHCLTKRLKSLRLRVDDQELVLPKACFPVSLQDNIDDPFILINHFFECPSQCLFFEILALHQYLPADSLSFSLLFECQRPFKSDFPVSTCFHLNCLPVINAFSQACEPVSVSQEQEAYLLYTDDREAALNIIKVTELSAKTLTGNPVKLSNPYLNGSSCAGISAVLHKLKTDFQLSLDVRSLQEPLVLSAQALVHQAQQCQHFYWKTAKLHAESGQLKGRLLEKLSRPFENIEPQSTALLAVLQSKIQIHTSLSDLHFFLRTLLCRHSPKFLRMIAGIAAFSAKSIFQVKGGLVTEGVVWKIQLNREHFDTPSALYQFAGLLERLIRLYRPANQSYQIEIEELPDETS